MTYFRNDSRKSEGLFPRPTGEDLRTLAADAIAPRHFFAGPPLSLHWEHHAAEDVPWELYKGRLLDGTQTRQRRTFEAWNIYGTDELGRSAEPLLSLKLDAGAGQLHVVRAMYCYAWEAYDAGDNVILSRETRRWVRELVATLELADFVSVAQLKDELICRLFQAVAGTSRLPLTSVESPLPAYSLGRLGYFYQPDGSAAEPVQTISELVSLLTMNSLGGRELTKHLETVLLAAPFPQMPAVSGAWVERYNDWVAGAESAKPRLDMLCRGFTDSAPATPQQPFERSNWGLLHQLGCVFNEAALTPYHGLAEKTVAFLQALESQGHVRSGEAADLLGQLLRQLGRHLTAYDLVTFHHRGANYPDALVLDVLLKEYLRRMEDAPALFLESPADEPPARRRKRLRRRALRQGWLLRRRYEGHLVPDEPTSPGESVRVLPPPYVRVPEQQIVNPALRRKRLYDGDPLDRHLGPRAAVILRQSIGDLGHPDELQELGTGLFVDRPLGGGKAPGEPDGTDLFSYLAFSRSIAGERLGWVTTESARLGGPHVAGFERALAVLDVPGIPAAQAAATARRAIVSLADLLRAADDFVLMRSTFSSWLIFTIDYVNSRELARAGLDGPRPLDPVLILRTTPPGATVETITVYDGKMRPRLYVEFDPGEGYVCRGGVEYPRSPLRVRPARSLPPGSLEDSPAGLDPGW